MFILRGLIAQRPSNSWVVFLPTLSAPQVPGNRMTSWNLATIFGPNLLHKAKNSDKEFAVESLARAEESVAVINVLQRLIESHHALFTVSRSTGALVTPPDPNGSLPSEHKTCLRASATV